MKTLAISLLTLVLVTLAPIQSFALPILKNVETELNLSANAGPHVLLGTQIVSNKVQLLKCKYDFSKQSGSVATIQLKAPDGSICKLPKGAIIIEGMIDVLTNPTSTGTTTIAVGSGQATNDLRAATAKANFTGLLDVVPAGTSLTAIKLTADRLPSMTVATTAITTGKFNVYIQYLLGD